jgi:hypothetical protein
MKWSTVIVLALLETIAIIAIIRLWRDKGRHLVFKLFWTVVLLIPLFGLLIYGFATLTPEAQADHTEDRIGADAGGFD